MSDAERLREQADLLLAMAIKARDEGQNDHADTLIAEASRLVNEADALEEAASRTERAAQDLRFGLQSSPKKKKE